jgi:hypothetical protein
MSVAKSSKEIFGTDLWRSLSRADIHEYGYTAMGPTGLNGLDTSTGDKEVGDRDQTIKQLRILTFCHVTTLVTS